MSLPEFFIKRPVFAVILNSLIVIVGLLAYRNLTVAEYPNVSVPIVTVTALYPNASAEVIESDLTFLLEEALAGIQGLDTMVSATMSGQTKVTLTFHPETSMDSALAHIRDHIGRVRDFWPKGAKEPSILQEGGNAEPFMWLTLESKTHSFAELTHFVQLHVKNTLRSVKGVSSVRVMGSPYTMEIALDRLKLFAHGLSAEDVAEVLAQNQVSLPAGKFRKELPVTLRLAMETPEDFENLVLAKNDHSVVLLKDVAEVRLSVDEREIVRANGRPGVFAGIIKASDGNPLSISDAIRKLMPNIRQSLPDGVEIHIVTDNANFIRQSLHSIQRSILEAGLLVLCIIFLFLRNLRATLIPLVTIPISLIGTLAFVQLFGFSINTISLLALVLAVGLVVDDAIVVVENIHHHIEKGLSPLAAAKKGSREIAFAIVAMTFTLASVYAPIAFIQGTIGRLFIEFALTLAASVVVSGVVALTLSPMMCARMLRSEQHQMFPKIDVALRWIEEHYHNFLNSSLRRPKTILALAALVLSSSVFLFRILPGEVAPVEDRGLVGAFVEPLPGKPNTVLVQYVEKVEKIFLQIPEVQSIGAIVMEEGSYVFANLKDWSERKRSAATIINDVRGKLAEVPSATAHGWSWETGLPGLDAISGRHGNLSVAIQAPATYKELAKEMDAFEKACAKDSVLKNIYHDLHLDFPGLVAKIDHKKMALLEVTPKAVAKSMETMFDKAEAIQFMKDGQRYNVVMKGATSPSNLHEVYVANDQGYPVALSSVVELLPTAEPQQLAHHNQMRAANLEADLGKNYRLSDGVSYLEKKLAQTLPSNYSYEFMGIAKQQKESSQLMLLLFGMALVFIYCVLAIQFESFTDPFIILLTVPLASCGALLMLWASRGSINIFSQVGLITLVGLITKHGILLVDFANQLMRDGQDKRHAIITAAQRRLRPILMTTAAMVFGSIPLMLSQGAGSEARRAIGFVLVGGLSFGTLLTLVVIPTFYILMKKQKSV